MDRDYELQTHQAEDRHWWYRGRRTVIERVLCSLGLAPGARILDAGCGSGRNMIELARHGTVTGIELSETSVALARQRGCGEVLEGSVLEMPFPDASFDVVISRFGVMFFDDSLAAFKNLARSMARGGRLAFACWQGLAHNEWILVLGMAVAQYVALPEPPPPGEPGMFALAEPDDIRRLLSAAGFEDISIDPIREQMILGGGGTVQEAVAFVRRGGMARAVLSNVDEATEAKVIESVTEALAQHETVEGVSLGAAAWLVQANRG